MSKMHKQDNILKHKPLVSVITPTYNRANLLPRLIESVRCQTFKDWELIIVDDRSIDETAAVVEKYRTKDRRIRYVASTHTKGPAGARNCGVEKVRGEFIAFLDSDDEWAENYLKDSIEALQAEDIDICLSLFCQEKSGIIEKKYEGIAKKMIAELTPFKKNNAFYFFDKNICDFMVTNWMFFYHLNAMVIRKHTVSTIGVFNEKLWGTEDFEFVFRALLYHDRFCLLNNFYYINHQSQDSLANIDKSDLLKTGVIDRIEKHRQYEVKMLKKMRDEIRGSQNVRKKKECINKISYHVGQKLYDLGSLVKRISKLRAFRYLAASLLYGFDMLKIKQIVLLLRPEYKEHSA